MFNRALESRKANTAKADNWAAFMTEVNKKKIVLTPWCEDEQCEDDVNKRSKEDSLAAETEGEEVLTGSAKTLCLPIEQEEIKEGAKCFACGKPATKHALWGRSY